MKAEALVNVVWFGFACHTPTKVLEIMTNCEQLALKPFLVVKMRHVSKTNQ